MISAISSVATLLVALHGSVQAVGAGIPSRTTAALATWHLFGEPTACSGATAIKNVVALRSDLFGAKSFCGMCTRVTGTKGSTVLMVVDKCVGPSCKELDISKDAFDRIADINEGVTKVTYSDFAPCAMFQSRPSSGKSIASGSEIQMTAAGPATDANPAIEADLESDADPESGADPETDADSETDANPATDAATDSTASGSDAQATTPTATTAANPATTPSPDATAGQPTEPQPTVSGAAASPTPPVQNTTDPALPTSAAETFGPFAISASVGVVVTITMLATALLE